MTSSKTNPSAGAAGRERTGDPRGAAAFEGTTSFTSLLEPSDCFIDRHIGPSDEDIAAMLERLGYGSLDELCRRAVPESIQLDRPLPLPGPVTERQALEELRSIAERNSVYRSYIGMGYYGTITPPVILRNILENPGWYTQYTPYQPEIAQGRLEVLLNFQTMVTDLTGMEVANASLLDEATAAAEAMAMCRGIGGRRRTRMLVADTCHPQTINVVQTRGESMGVTIEVGDPAEFDLSGDKGADVAGVLLQYPNTHGRIEDYSDLAKRVHEAGALLVVATDPLALTVLTPPGEWGADIVVGSTQRFGVPMGYGGPHAAFMATRQKHVRKMPGRLVGVSRDANGRAAYRLAIQTREQHIKRDRATSNICTAQVLLAIMAAFYAIYHGPEGLRRIATRVRLLTGALRSALIEQGHEVPEPGRFFDTLHIGVRNGEAERVYQAALARRINLRHEGNGCLGVSLDETTTVEHVRDLIEVFAAAAADGAPGPASVDVEALAHRVEPVPEPFARKSEYLTHDVFHLYRAEHELLRYIYRLQSRDLSLTTSMIPLGSCTIKLNGTSLMIRVTWPEFAHIHPYAPAHQAEGYRVMGDQLADWLAKMTGFASVSLQPNAGSQGEYAGLLAIRGYHQSRGEGHRNVCLIPVSAHGTNPASAVIAGFEIVSIDCDPQGNIDVEDLRAKAQKHADRLGALMITYPSTHGVFEQSIVEICSIVHEHGGQVYLDGANLNALLGLALPGQFGADVCHFNLHKTFCIPHGGGGPGMGPIAVAEHLAPFLPGDPLTDGPGEGKVGPVSAAAMGSPSILPISWMYIRMMGAAGLKKATQVAILNANYLARRLSEGFEVLFTGERGTVAHEFILDTRHFRISAEVDVDDIAKRLMDFGFHAPTMSWPVPGTLMIEPTESESRAELDRFCEALMTIREEIAEVEKAQADVKDNVLKGAPHTAEAVSANLWTHGYAREKAAYPLPRLRQFKFWPPVGRVDNPYGDRHLVCTCPSVEEMAAAT